MVILRKVAFVVAVLLLYSVSVYSANEDIASLFDEGTRLLDKGLYAEAKEKYERIIEINPRYARAYNNLGLISSVDDMKIRETINYFLEAAKIDHFYPEPFANLGTICYKLGQYDRAAKYLKRAVDLSPENVSYRFTLGWIYLSGVKDTGKAVEQLKKAVEINPDYAKGYYLLGLAYADMNNKIEVFDAITKLRMLKNENLADMLEKLIRTPSKEFPVDDQIGGNGESQKNRPETAKMVYKIESKPEPESQPKVNVGSGNMGGSGTIQFEIKIQAPKAKETVRTRISPK